MEMEELSKINEKHKDVNWIMFTDKPLEEIKSFAQKYNLDKAENIHGATILNLKGAQNLQWLESLTF